MRLANLSQSAAVTWSTTSQTAQGMLLSDPTLANSPEFLSYINSAIAYVNISDLIGLDYVQTFASQQLAGGALYSCWEAPSRITDANAHRVSTMCATASRTPPSRLRRAYLSFDTARDSTQRGMATTTHLAVAEPVSSGLWGTAASGNGIALSSGYSWP